MPGLFPERVSDAVINAMSDYEKLSLDVLNDEVSERQFSLLVLKLLKETSTTLEGKSNEGLKTAS